MPIVDSISGRVVKKYKKDELIEKAKEMRAYNMIAITAAGSGHPGGSLSIMDMASALYLNVAVHDPNNPGWEDRDRIFWSAGHKAPALYSALGVAGYFPVEKMMTLRKFGSPFEGHPNSKKVKGVEFSSGSLGHGLGVAVGSALNARLEGKNYRSFCIMGDGEQDEGSVWEAVMCAAHYKLDNLVAIIDHNKLQIDGMTEEVMCLSSLAEKYKSFCWNVIEIDGHNMEEILESFEAAKNFKGHPTVIIADTIKGKGVSYAEHAVGYHGIAPKDGRIGEESLEIALQDIGYDIDEREVDRFFKIAEDYQRKVDEKIQKKLPSFSKEYWWNKSENMKAEMNATRNGFGKALEEIGEDTSLVAHGADITSSIRMDHFYKNNPEREKRFFSVGVAEANMIQVASGFAKEGKISFAGSFGVFATGRAWEQIRTTVCYNNFNVKIAGAHGGLLVGADGATHQALEEIAVTNYLPNMTVTVPCDAVETYKITKAVAYKDGPALIRYAREATACVCTEETPFKLGEANVVRFRGEKDNFIDAFEWSLSSEYENEKEDLSLIACGPMVPEAMRAAWILKEEYGIETRVLDMHTVKPLDRKGVMRAAEETGAVITVEEHQIGGFGNIVAGEINTSKNYNSPLVMDMVGVKDKFGESGAPWELMIEYELVAEFIAKKAKKLFERKKEA